MIRLDAVGYAIKMLGTTVFAALLFAGLLLNQIFNPARNRLQRLGHSEYELPETQSVGAQARS